MTETPLGREDAEDVPRDDRAAEAMFLVDAEGRITFASPAAGRMLGRPAEDLLGKPLHDVVHAGSSEIPPLPASDSPLSAAIRSGGALPSHEDVFVRGDGKAVPVECSLAPIRQGAGVGGAVLLAREITGRDQPGRARRAVEARFRATFENAAVGIALVDLSGRPLRVDRRSARSSGIPSGSFSG
jgi:PAS domain S-box-containing protein